MEASDGTYQSLTSTFNSTGTNKTMNTAAFKPGRIFYRNKNTDVAANSSVFEDNKWALTQFNIDVRYSVNYPRNFVAGKNAYLVGTIDSQGYFKLDTTDSFVLESELPTTEDGKVYIFLGTSYTSNPSYMISLESEHPMYWYHRGAIRLYSPDSDPSDKIENNYVITMFPSTYAETTNSSEVNSYSVLTSNFGSFSPIAVLPIEIKFDSDIPSTTGVQFIESGETYHELKIEESDISSALLAVDPTGNIIQWPPGGYIDNIWGITGSVILDNQLMPITYIRSTGNGTAAADNRSVSLFIDTNNNIRIRFRGPTSWEVYGIKLLIFYANTKHISYS